MSEKEIEKLQSMLLEDDFIRFITMNAKKLYVIESKESQFHKVPNIIGIFKNEENWMVYETTRKQEVYAIKKYEKQLDAYQDAAARDDLSYIPSEIINQTDNYDKIDTNKELLKKVKNMINRLESDLKFCKEEETISLYKEDIEFLNDVITPTELKRSKVRK